MANMVMTINLRKRLIKLHTPRRRKRAVGLVREEVARLAKTKVERVKVNRELNEFLEKHASGASFLWARMKLNVEKTGDAVEVKLFSTKAAATAPVSAASIATTKAEQKKTPQADEPKKPK